MTRFFRRTLLAEGLRLCAAGRWLIVATDWSPSVGTIVLLELEATS